ncbi:hypothetical protein [Arundinibacter roseus]|uniref:hypothetical protein n=1 Tax=Arundinibacter roseus TaxID=2070510 RepID=UPI00140549BF|nr:hypothetical protein [Arundinibacter roseus]
MNYLSISELVYKTSEYEVLRRRCVELKESGWNRSAEATEGHRLSIWVDRGLG